VLSLAVPRQTTFLAERRLALRARGFGPGNSRGSGLARIGVFLA
jgi:hypothetical protein